MAEMRKVILAEVLTLRTATWKIYDKFVTVYMGIFHLYGFQQQCMKIAQTLKEIHGAIAHVQEWTMKYQRELLYFHKIMKP